ncbi:MAG: hypothetical protein ACD_3C00154G0009 [uncultured bacterium (gcode 4)]|uniref:NADAR domain-containing protein n=1 Tax=uncultured bacterium (gcode 4) TaxID=1234023 RepID=K2F9H2_9BACT|nr:MAG: hypothetical protein ACD_3C00154G0009 [uncultured bacterium (gcode 4)]
MQNKVLDSDQKTLNPIFNLNDSNSWHNVLLQSKYLNRVNDIMDWRTIDAVAEENKYEFFWKEGDICSQWYKSDFLCDWINFKVHDNSFHTQFRDILDDKLIEYFTGCVKDKIRGREDFKEEDIERLNFDFYDWKDIKFTCAEQFMMFCKALLFWDAFIAFQIMLTNDPKEIKRLWREIAWFDEEIWKENRENIVFVWNSNKFLQNPDLLKYLLKTEWKELVEASPFDKIWWIWLEKEDKRANDKSEWLWLNLLWGVITSLRDIFLKIIIWSR